MTFLYNVNNVHIDFLGNQLHRFPPTNRAPLPGAVVQYVGQTALFSGTKAERKRAKDWHNQGMTIVVDDHSG